MLCVRQARLIEDHWETIARRALDRIRTEIPRSTTLSDQLILDRVKDLLSHLSDWLTVPTKGASVNATSASAGCGRRKAGICTSCCGRYS